MRPGGTMTLDEARKAAAPFAAQHNELFEDPGAIRGPWDTDDSTGLSSRDRSRRA
jgi:hypothetical protein